MIIIETQPHAGDVCGIYNAMAEQEANARLIAAGPELLAATETLLLRCEAADGDAAWASIRAVIARAKGGTP